ncbi:M48 family metallopeptidase [Candidatus Azambacteria bacterium]|nr:M48 family metallopeptidase [Candidatus Azambacteria bacterium]
MVYSDGRVIVTSPFGVRQSTIEKFVADKNQWVLGKLQFFQNLKSQTIRNVGNQVIRTFSFQDYLENKDQAWVLATERITFYNKIYGFSFNQIFIKNQKTRWGSCSSKKNLNLNYKIVFLSPEHQDYIIVHELCHLKEFNHSRQFWILVKKTIPNYLKIKKELRHHKFYQ